MTDENATPDTDSKPRNVTLATQISRAYAKVQQLKQKIRKAEAVEKVRRDKSFDRFTKLQAALLDAVHMHGSLIADETPESVDPHTPMTADEVPDREPTDAGPPIESD